MARVIRAIGGHFTPALRARNSANLPDSPPFRSLDLTRTVAPLPSEHFHQGHPDDLRRRLRCYRKIRVICDNASFHDSRVVRGYLAEHGDRIVIHFLPKYAPDLNPIERIWWHLHEEITRNHKCQTMDELLDQVFEWLEHRRLFEVERSACLRSRAA